MWRKKTGTRVRQNWSQNSQTHPPTHRHIKRERERERESEIQTDRMRERDADRWMLNMWHS